MSQIQISNLTYTYHHSAEPVFEDLTLTLDTSWKLGLTGRNGRGKTTLLHLLEHADQYPQQIQCPITCLYYPYQVSDPSKTPIELFGEICPGKEEWELFCELSLLGLLMDEDLYERAFSTFSSGEQKKILLACLFVRRDGFILLDEPEAGLDEDGCRKLSAYLQRKKGFILVSHDRDLLDAVTDHTLSIERKKVRVQKGGFSTWYQTVQDEQIQAEARNERLQKEARRLEKARQKSDQWARKAEKAKKRTVPNEKLDRGFMGHKAAKLMKRSKNLEKRQQEAVDQKKGLLENIETAERMRMEVRMGGSRQVLTLRQVRVFYDSHPVNPQAVSFEIHPGDRLQIKGKNGSGKSSLIHAILKDSVEFQGTIQKPSGLTVSYAAQNPEHMQGSLREYAERCGADQTRLFTLLRKLGMERESFERDLSSFSLGEQKKVEIASSLCVPADLYIWDEPLAHLDVTTRIQIEQMILDSQPTLLFVEHDERFGQNIATRIYNLETGKEEDPGS